jgi:hypothetical protein
MSAPAKDSSRLFVAAEALPNRAVGWQEITAVTLLIALSDLTIYRSQGFAGYTLFLFLSPVFLFLGSRRSSASGWTIAIGVMMWILAAKSLWLGSATLLIVSIFVLLSFAMTLSSFPPYLMELAIFAAQVLVAGYQGLMKYGQFLMARPRIKRPNWINIGLPLVTLIAFSVLFILANPDLLKSFNEGLSRFVSELRSWLFRYGPGRTEVVFWFIALWISVGLLRPMIQPSMFVDDSNQSADSPFATHASLYAAFRNTLVTLIALFAIYLAFEFKTLWFRVFPTGFYYSGYAHEGAAWLTVALALATAVLSLIFRGSTLGDPRLPGLRRLAWIWSAENMLLAMAVYHRLLIYIGFNGMTRMRVIGFLGISTVVAGLILVLWKIAHRHDFLWLLRRHLWAVALAVYLFAITPVDTLVMSYNVRRILSGDPAPSVQISVHPIDADGIIQLVPLLNCQDTMIRNGIRAMLAGRHDQAEAIALKNESLGWTTYQIADHLLLRTLRNHQSRWSTYRDPRERSAALDQFHRYAYQWY